MADQMWGDKITGISSTALYPMGTLRHDKAGRSFRYGKAHDAITAGQAVAFYGGDTSACETTSDISDAKVTQPAGFAFVAVTDDYYFWCQTGGPGANSQALLTDAGISDNDQLVLISGTDGAVDTKAAIQCGGTDIPIWGQAFAADTSDQLASTEFTVCCDQYWGG